jgi:hypothetical protein
MVGKCCGDPDHITNFADPEYETDISGELEVIDDLLNGWGQAHSTATFVLNFCDFLDAPDAPLRNMMVDGKVLWSKQDPVHMVPEAYSAMALALVSALDELGGCDSESTPAAKRPRLESVVVRTASENKRGSTVLNQERKQSWSAGVLPEKSKSNNTQFGGGRGNGWPRFSWRGRGQRGHVRGRGRFFRY